MKNSIVPDNQRSEFVKDSLCEKLDLIVKNLPNQKLTLLEIRDLLGRDGMLLFIALLTIVFLIPISIPGLSTVFGATILLIGITLLLGRNLWLPAAFLKKELPTEKLKNHFNAGLKWFNHLEKISKPHRLTQFTENRLVAIFNNLSIVLASLLLMMPFGFIPFSNTLPAITLLFYSVGMLQKDGVSILLGYTFNTISLIYFSILISGGTYVIYELFKNFVQ